MAKYAFLFPGQGAQYVGMGKDLYETSDAARGVIDTVDSILDKDLKAVMFEGPEDTLKKTDYAQPAIFAASMAAMRAMQEKCPDVKPAFTAGLSLGEYSALAASGALSVEDTVRLIERRGAFMQEAADQKKGAMAAVIGLDPEAIRKICDQSGAEVANFNAPDQTVITGEAAAVEAACGKLTEAGAKRVIPLSVSGAFHSSLMQSAADKFREVLDRTEFAQAEVPLIGNADAQVCISSDEIRAELVGQITSSVQWVKTIAYMAGEGVDTFIEIGPGKVLKGLLRRIDRGLTVVNVEKADDLDQLSAEPA
ncbi:MAG: ACP S-malonyltransferase [Candidatus Omnitrophota bacterium]